MPRVVTAGETMVLMQAGAPGRLRHATTLELGIGGAESNVAIGLARLGIKSDWVSRVGRDELGELVLARVRAEGVGVEAVERSDAVTGLYLRERLATGVEVYYYRKDSAAAELEEGAFDPSFLADADLVHLTGITPALSASCQGFVLWLALAANERGIPVSYDVNYRAKLWSAEAARCFLDKLMPCLDVLFIGDDEVSALWGEDAPVLELVQGPKEVILKQGAGGCAARICGQNYGCKAFEVDVCDPIGAGDAFAAGYLASKLWGDGPSRRLQLANAMGAFAVMTLGDYEGLPSRDELFNFVNGVKRVGR